MPQILITKLSDGERSTVFHVSIEGDGLGDMDEVVIDPADFGSPGPSLTIEKLWYDLSGFSAALRFEYLASDTPVWSMSEGNGTCLDFSHFGGLKDRSNPLDGSGKLKLSTSGLDLGEKGSIVIKARKD